MESVNKVFKVVKQHSLIDMYNKEDNTHQYLNYDKFESLAVLHFGYEKASIILDYLNESKSLIIDFENKKALLIKEKTPNWSKSFKEYMSADKVMQAYRRDVTGDIPSFLQDLEDETVGTLLF